MSGKGKGRASPLTGSFPGGQGQKVIMPSYDFHGRYFGAFRKGQWLFPVDELEKDRLDIFHNLMLRERKGKLYEAPLIRAAGGGDGMREGSSSGQSGSPTQSGPIQILDLGTGSGLWVHQMAELLEDEDAVVCGVDLYNNLHPETVSKRNFFAGGVDIEDPWEAMYDFFDFASQSRRRYGFANPDIDKKNWDLIRASMLNGGVKCWADVYRSMFRHLKPGTGWIELIEIDWIPRRDGDIIADDSTVYRWAEELCQLMDSHGRTMRVDPDTKGTLERVGFTDVKERKVQLLHSPWRNSDANDETLARWFNLAFTYGVESMTIGPFMQKKGLSKPELDAFVKHVHDDSCMLRHRTYCYMHIWTARRPALGE